MASTKKNETKSEQTVTKRKSMLGAYLPEGKTEDDIVLTGQLLPQYLGLQLLEKLSLTKGKRVADLTDEDLEEITPCIGLFDRVEVLPVQQRKDQKDFSPFSLVIRELREGVVGFRGKDEEREEVPVDRGGDILFPVTGQTTVNRQILEMVTDLEHVYLFAGRPVGTQKVNNQPTPMIKWEIEIVKLDVKRIDKGASWALPPWYAIVAATGDLRASMRNKEHVGLLHVHSTDGFDATPAGNIINRKTGEIHGRLAADGRVLPPEKRLAEGAPLVDKPAQQAQPS